MNDIVAGLARGAGACIALLVAAVVCAAPAASQDIAVQVEICTSCHGENGLPTEPDIPIIWGQEFYYLYVQLKDYKAGRRANLIMQGIVADLSKGEMQALAQHFAEKTWPATGFKSDEADIRKGENVATAGQCPQCHLASYRGDSRIPRMAGQQPKYLERTMQDFKTKKRQNAPAIASLIKGFSDDDIRAMARFLAGL